MIGGVRETPRSLIDAPSLLPYMGRFERQRWNGSTLSVVNLTGQVLSVRQADGSPWWTRNIDVGLADEDVLNESAIRDILRDEERKL